MTKEAPQLGSELQGRRRPPPRARGNAFGRVNFQNLKPDHKPSQRRSHGRKHVGLLGAFIRARR